MVQGLQGMDPKAKLAGAAEVTLTEAEVWKLRKDMQEQETLIQGYQVLKTHNMLIADVGKSQSSVQHHR